MSLLACRFLAKQATFIDSRRNTDYPRIAKTTDDCAGDYNMAAQQPPASLTVLFHEKAARLRV